MFLFVLKSRDLPDSYYVPVLGTRGKWNLVRSIAEGIQRTQAPSVRTVIASVLQMLAITHPDSFVLKDAVLRFVKEVNGTKKITRLDEGADPEQEPDGYVLRRKIGDIPEYLFADSERIDTPNTYWVVPDNNVILPPAIKVFPASGQGAEQLGRAIYTEAYRRGYNAGARFTPGDLVPKSAVFEAVPVAVTTPSAFILLEEGAYPEGARLF